MDFHSHDGIITSDNGDYVNNIWDKGHCCPFKGSNCNDQAAFESFSYVNCSLQDQYLNRGTWRLLENYERELTSAGVVRVKVVLEWGPSAFWLPTGAMVPSGFYKYIWLNGHLHGVWYFPNKKPTTSDYMQYKIQ